MDRYQHAPLRFASCRERERERERVSRDKSQFEAVAKQEQSETILSSLRSVVVSGENCFSLSLSLEWRSLPRGGKRKEEFNVQGSSISRGDGIKSRNSNARVDSGCLRFIEFTEGSWAARRFHPLPSIQPAP